MSPARISRRTPWQASHSKSTVAVLNTRHFRRQFMSSLSREMVALSIVSPFVRPIPGFDTVGGFFGHLKGRMPQISITLVTRPPDDRQNNVLSWQEAELIVRLGVSLVIRPSPTLHSKVYYVQYADGDTSSFVGSANFTTGGFERNDESIAFWRRGTSDAEVERELARLTGRGSFNLIQWKIKATPANVNKGGW